MLVSAPAACSCCKLWEQLSSSYQYGQNIRSFRRRCLFLTTHTHTKAMTKLLGFSICSWSQVFASIHKVSFPFMGRIIRNTWTCMRLRHVCINNPGYLSNKRQIYFHYYSIYRMYSDRQAWANSVNPDVTQQNTASNLGLHCLPLIQQFIDTTSVSKL